MTAEHSAETVESAPISPAPAAEIATLPPSTLGSVAATLNPRTGEPRRSVLIWLASASCLLATASAISSLLFGYWTAVTNLAQAFWLTAQFAKPEILTQVLLVVGLTTAALLIAISNVITGYYSWFGHRWSRIAGIVSGSLSLLVLLLNPIGWPAIGFALLGAGLLWTPGATAFFQAWDAHRHPSINFAPPAVSVAYGPLPRYRRA
jgi:hypothetical protein